MRARASPLFFLKEPLIKSRGSCQILFPISQKERKERESKNSYFSVEIRSLKSIANPKSGFKIINPDFPMEHTLLGPSRCRRRRRCLSSLNNVQHKNQHNQILLPERCPPIKTQLRQHHTQIRIRPIQITNDIIPT